MTQKLSITSKTFDVLLGLILIGVFYRLYNINAASYWFDELFSAVSSSPLRSPAPVYHHTLNVDVHPPFYQLLLWGWYHVFGFSEIAGRFLSAAAGILLIPALYHLGKQLFNKDVGCYAALFATFNFYLVYYARETRSYSLLTLLTVVSFICFVNLLDRKKGALWYVIVTALLVNTHYFGVFVFFSQCATVLVLFISRKMERKVFIIYCVSGVAVCLSLLHMLQRISSISSVKNFWIGKPQDTFFRESFTLYFGGEHLALMFALLLLLGVFSLFRRSSASRQTTILVLWIFSLLAVPYAVSIYIRPLLTIRNTIPLLPAVLILAAYGITTIRDKSVRACVAAVMVLLSVTTLSARGIFTEKEKMVEYGAQRQDYRTIVLMADKMRKGQNVYASYPDPFNTYAALLGLSLRVSPLKSLNRDNPAARTFWVVGDNIFREPVINYAEKQGEFKAENTWVVKYRLPGDAEKEK